MTIKCASLSVIAVVCAGLMAGPALAQNATSAPPAPAAAPAPAAGMQGMKMTKAKKPVKKMAKVAKLTCMDYAYQSQDEKDCEAGKIKPPNWR